METYSNNAICFLIYLATIFILSYSYNRCIFCPQIQVFLSKEYKWRNPHFQFFFFSMNFVLLHMFFEVPFIIGKKASPLQYERMSAVLLKQWLRYSFSNWSQPLIVKSLRASVQASHLLVHSESLIASWGLYHSWSLAVWTYDTVSPTNCSHSPGWGALLIQEGKQEVCLCSQREEGEGRLSLKQ